MNTPLKFKRSGVLQEGIYRMSWEEFCKAYGTNSYRKSLIRRMSEPLRLLRASGCTRIFIDGSFVSNPKIELEPGDYDVCFFSSHLDEGREPLDVRLNINLTGSEQQKQLFGGEFYFAEDMSKLPGKNIFEFFQTDKDTNQPKGIVELDIRRFK